MKDDVLNLRQLDTFLAVARTGSFHGAARALNSTQPAISSRIAQLEQALGVRLFERTTRSVRLTPRGHSLVSHAVRVFAATSDLRLGVGNRDVITGIVRIGVVDTIAMTSLAELVRQVDARFPLVDLQIDVDLSDALVRKLASGALDLACVVTHSAPHGQMTERLIDPTFGWFVGRRFAMPGGKLTAEVLANTPLLLHSGSQQADHVARWLQQIGARPKRVHSCNSLAAIIRMTQIGIGLSVLPVLAVAEHVQRGLLVPVPSALPPIDNPLVMIRHHASVDPAVASVAGVVRAVAGQGDAAKTPREDSQEEAGMSHFTAVEARGGRAGTATGTSLATEAARDVLRAGGNVVDAAIAASAVLCVVLPHAVALGGDLFALIRSGRDGSITAVNATGGAPGRADIAAFRAAGHRHVPLIGPLSIQPPGLVAGWQTLRDRWGSRGLSTLLGPAIDLAQRGFPTGARLARFCAELSAELMPVAGWGDCFAPNGSPLAAGAMFRQERLASTLRRIGKDGAAGFYEGDVAKDLAATVQDAGGLLSVDDLRRVAVEVAPAMRATLHGLAVYSQPPVSQGVVLLRALGLVDRFVGDVQDERTLWPVAAAALRQAFAERLALLGDGEDRRARAAAMLDDRLAAKTDIITAQAHDGRETTTLVVTDHEGNTAALIQSVFADFGSGVVGRETGVLLNNRLSAFFLDPFHPNALRPGRRTMHTLHNFIAVDEDGRVCFAGGSPGGDNQPQVNLQFLLRVALLGETPREAIAAPRFTIWPGTNPTDAAHGLGTVVKCEPGISDAVRRAFGDAGFAVGEDAAIGSLKLVGAADGALAAWADTRREAAVAAI